MSQGYAKVAKLVGTGVAGTGNIQQGWSVKLSDDGNYLFVGGNIDDGGLGAVWFYQKVAGVWTQKQKIVPNGYSAPTQLNFGQSLAVNPSVNTLIVGGYRDNSNVGASFVFTFDVTTWTQQAKLVGSGYSSSSYQGWAVGLSADANTAIVGGYNDASGVGAAWIFVRSGTTWSQQGAKFVASDKTEGANQGCSVAITSDGNLVIVSGRGDSTNVGAIWVYLRSGTSWSQVGSKIKPTDITGTARFGTSLALSGDDQWLIVGGHIADSKGAAWAFKRNGNTFQQFGKKLVGVGSSTGSSVGYSVATNKYGSIVAVGGYGDSGSTGAVWVYAFNGTNFNQLDNKITASDASAGARQGYSVSLDRSGSRLLFGGTLDNGGVGAAWIYKNITITKAPSAAPTFKPTAKPTIEPTTQPSALPTVKPTTQPSVLPTTQPSALPTTQPSALPTVEPTTQPSVLPTTQPSASPTVEPTTQPSTLPTVEPTTQPSELPTTQPSVLPTVEPTTQPSALPTTQPSMLPTVEPTTQPSVLPTTQPSVLPTVEPTTQPSALPTAQPSALPTVEPTTQPSALPTAQPSALPTVEPTTQPSELPTTQPSALPTVEPTTQPSAWPTIEPTYLPTLTPTDEPTWTPTQCPTMFPSITPTWSPTALPTTTAPSIEPSISPSFAPIQAASSKLSSAGIAGIAVGAFVVFGSVIWIVVMQMKHFGKPPQQEKSSVADQLESSNAVELKI